MSGNPRHGVGVVTFVDFDNMWIQARWALFDAIAPTMGDDAARRVVKIFSPVMLLERLKSVVKLDEGVPLQTRCYLDLFTHQGIFPRAVCRRVSGMGIELIHCAKQLSPKDKGRERRTKDIVDPLLADSAARLDEATRANVTFAFATHDADLAYSTMRRIRDKGRRVVALLIQGRKTHTVREVVHDVHELWFPEFLSLAERARRLSKEKTADGVRELARSGGHDFTPFGHAIRGIQRILEADASFGEDPHVFADWLSEMQNGNGQPCSREEIFGIISALEFLRVLTPRGEVLMLDTAHPITEWAIGDTS